MFTLGDVADILDTALGTGISIVDTLSQLSDAADQGELSKQKVTPNIEDNKDSTLESSSYDESLMQGDVDANVPVQRRQPKQNKLRPSTIVVDNNATEGVPIGISEQGVPIIEALGDLCQTADSLFNDFDNSDNNNSVTTDKERCAMLESVINVKVNEILESFQRLDLSVDTILTRKVVSEHLKLNQDAFPGLVARSENLHTKTDSSTNSSDLYSNGYPSSQFSSKTLESLKSNDISNKQPVVLRNLPKRSPDKYHNDKSHNQIHTTEKYEQSKSCDIKLSYENKNTQNSNYSPKNSPHRRTYDLETKNLISVEIFPDEDLNNNEIKNISVEKFSETNKRQTANQHCSPKRSTYVLEAPIKSELSSVEFEDDSHQEIKRRSNSSNNSSPRRGTYVIDNTSQMNNTSLMSTDTINRSIDDNVSSDHFNSIVDNITKLIKPDEKVLDTNNLQRENNNRNSSNSSPAKRCTYVIETQNYDSIVEVENIKEPPRRKTTYVMNKTVDPSELKCVANSNATTVSSGVPCGKTTYVVNRSFDYLTTIDPSELKCVANSNATTVSSDVPCGKTTYLVNRSFDSELLSNKIILPPCGDSPTMFFVRRELEIDPQQPAVDQVLEDLSDDCPTPVNVSPRNSAGSPQTFRENFPNEPTTSIKDSVNEPTSSIENSLNESTNSIENSMNEPVNSSPKKFRNNSVEEPTQSSQSFREKCINDKPTSYEIDASIQLDKPIKSKTDHFSKVKTFDKKSSLTTKVEDFSCDDMYKDKENREQSEDKSSIESPGYFTHSFEYFCNSPANNQSGELHKIQINDERNPLGSSVAPEIHLNNSIQEDKSEENGESTKDTDNKISNKLRTEEDNDFSFKSLFTAEEIYEAFTLNEPSNKNTANEASNPLLTSKEKPIGQQNRTVVKKEAGTKNMFDKNPYASKEEFNCSIQRSIYEQDNKCDDYIEKPINCNSHHFKHTRGKFYKRKELLLRTGSLDSLLFKKQRARKLSDSLITQSASLLTDNTSRRSSLVLIDSEYVDRTPREFDNNFLIDTFISDTNLHLGSRENSISDPNLHLKSEYHQNQHLLQDSFNVSASDSNLLKSTEYNNLAQQISSSDPNILSTPQASPLKSSRFNYISQPTINKLGLLAKTMSTSLSKLASLNLMKKEISLSDRSLDEYFDDIVTDEDTDDTRSTFSIASNYSNRTFVITPDKLFFDGGNRESRSRHDILYGNRESRSHDDILSSTSHEHCSQPLYARSVSTPQQTQLDEIGLQHSRHESTDTFTILSADEDDVIKTENSFIFIDANESTDDENVYSAEDIFGPKEKMDDSYERFNADDQSQFHLPNSNHGKLSRYRNNTSLKEICTPEINIFNEPEEDYSESCSSEEENSQKISRTGTYSTKRNNNQTSLARDETFLIDQKNLLHTTKVERNDTYSLNKVERNGTYSINKEAAKRNSVDRNNTFSIKNNNLSVSRNGTYSKPNNTTVNRTGTYSINRESNANEALISRNGTFSIDRENYGLSRSDTYSKGLTRNDTYSMNEVKLRENVGREGQSAQRTGTYVIKEQQKEFTIGDIVPKREFSYDFKTKKQKKRSERSKSVTPAKQKKPTNNLQTRSLDSKSQGRPFYLQNNKKNEGKQLPQKHTNFLRKKEPLVKPPESTEEHAWYTSPKYAAVRLQLQEQRRRYAEKKKNEEQQWREERAKGLQDAFVMMVLNQEKENEDPSSYEFDQPPAEQKEQSPIAEERSPGLWFVGIPGSQENISTASDSKPPEEILPETEKVREVVHTEQQMSSHQPAVEPQKSNFSPPKSNFSPQSASSNRIPPSHSQPGFTKPEKDSSEHLPSTNQQATTYPAPSSTYPPSQPTNRLPINQLHHFSVNPSAQPLVDQQFTQPLVDQQFTKDQSTDQTNRTFSQESSGHQNQSSFVPSLSEQLSSQPDHSSSRPNHPSSRPDQPSSQPDNPSSRPDHPSSRPDNPSGRPDHPSSQPDNPTSRLGVENEAVDEPKKSSLQKLKELSNSTSIDPTEHPTNATVTIESNRQQQIHEHNANSTYTQQHQQSLQEQQQQIQDDHWQQQQHQQHQEKQQYNQQQQQIKDDHWRQQQHQEKQQYNQQQQQIQDDHWQQQQHEQKQQYNQQQQQIQDDHWQQQQHEEKQQYNQQQQQQQYQQHQGQQQGQHSFYQQQNQTYLLKTQIKDHMGYNNLQPVIEQKNQNIGQQNLNQQHFEQTNGQHFEQQNQDVPNQHKTFTVPPQHQEQHFQQFDQQHSQQINQQKHQPQQHFERQEQQPQQINQQSQHVDQRQQINKQTQQLNDQYQSQQHQRQQITEQNSNQSQQSQQQQQTQQHQSQQINDHQQTLQQQQSTFLVTPQKVDQKSCTFTLTDNDVPTEMTPEQLKKKERFLKNRQKRQEQERLKKEKKAREEERLLEAKQLEEERRTEEMTLKEQHERRRKEQLEEEQVREETERLQNEMMNKRVHGITYSTMQRRQDSSEDLRSNSASRATRISSNSSENVRKPPRQQSAPPPLSSQLPKDNPPTHSVYSEYKGPVVYTKPSGKSNRKIIQNAIAHCCLCGEVNREAKNKCLEALSLSEGSHFLVLFREGLKFRSVYDYNPDTQVVTRIYGIGPKSITPKMITKYFKYNSGGKAFNSLDTLHLSIQVDGVMIKKEMWEGRKAKPAKK